MVEQELVADPVQLVGGDAGRDVAADLGHRLGRDPPGDAHPLDGVGVLDLRAAERRGRGLVDVLGPGDGGVRRAAGRAAPGSDRESRRRV